MHRSRCEKHHCIREIDHLEERVVIFIGEHKMKRNFGMGQSALFFSD